MMLAEPHRALMEAVMRYSEVTASYRWEWPSAAAGAAAVHLQHLQPKTARTSATETSVTYCFPLPAIFNSAFLVTQW